MGQINETVISKGQSQYARWEGKELPKSPGLAIQEFLKEIELFTYKDTGRVVNPIFIQENLEDGVTAYDLLFVRVEAKHGMAIFLILNKGHEILPVGALFTDTNYFDVKPEYEHCRKAVETHLENLSKI